MTRPTSHRFLRFVAPLVCVLSGGSQVAANAQCPTAAAAFFSFGGGGEGGGGGPKTNPLASVSTTPVVICPGFGNDEIDYESPLSQSREVGLVSALERRGFDPSLISVVPVKRLDWLRVAGGLLDVPDFYLGTALPTGGGYGWYLRRLKASVDEAHERSGGERVLVIGHSAGGWLARAAMGDGVWAPAGRSASPSYSSSPSGDGDEKEGVGSTIVSGEVRTSDRIRCLVTVGAIHRPPSDAGTCVTRGALTYTAEQYPGAYLSAEGVGYVSVGGDAILGEDSRGTKNGAPASESDELYAARGEGSASRVAYNSYEAVCGRGGVLGDGVVPLDWTQLDGARQIRLEGVLHSINEAGTTLPTDRWYGSEGVIDRWLPVALEEAGIASERTDGRGGVGGGGMLGYGNLALWARERAAAAQEMLS